MNNITRHKVSRLLKARVFIRRHRLPVALGLAISIALCLVLVSVNIYMLAGFSRYDLSRPGYEKERKEIIKPVPQTSYDTTGIITSQTINDFLAEYDGRVRDINAFGNFSDSSLGDEELSIQKSDTTFSQ